MHNHEIIISDGEQTITMPVTRELSVGGEEDGKEIIMAKGKIVKEVRGHRAVVSAVWDWVPPEIMAALHIMLRRGGFFEVTYHDPSGAKKTGMYSLRYPESRVFKFSDDGSAMWRGVALTMRAQEVE